MNKLVLGLALAGTLGLTACTDGPKEPVTPDVNTTSGAQSGVALTKAVYAPGDGNIPLPNDLVFNGTLDLTLNIPADDPSDLSDPIVALNSQDGWSAIAPMSISFFNSEGADIDASTVIPGQTVRVFEVNVARPEVMPGVIAPTGPVTGVVRELTPVQEFVATYAGAGTVAVIPTRPLGEQKAYMVVVTNGIQDTNGNAVIADSQYTIAKTQSPLPAGPTQALEPVRQLVNAMESAAEAAGVDRDSIVVSFQFTVQSMSNQILAAKGFYIDLPFSMGAPPATAFTPLNLPSNMVNPALSGDALVSVGQITLPYFLTAPADATQAPVVVSEFWRAAAMVPDGQGGMMQNPLAGGNLTYANPLPEKTKDETVPLLVTLPSNGNCPKPYPVLIFQHGITSDRTAALGIADAMARACVAVVSMDMPLHGLDSSAGSLFAGYDVSTVHERTFGVDLVDNTTGAPGPDGIPDSSGAHTINLQNLQTARDNLRQSIMDLLALEKAVPSMDIDGDNAPDFDATKIYFMGHSLGGIVGSSFLAYSDMVSAAVLANPGSGIAGLLDASLTFGPRIRAGLQAAGVDPNSPDYQRFLVAAQTLVDSADPANTAAMALANDIPTLLIRVRDDAVVPNNSPTAPLSGTDPMAALLGLTPVAATTPGEIVQGARLWSRINSGLHSTVLTPLDDQGMPTFLAQTTEMQTHIVSFLTSGGAAVQVVDPSLLD